MLGWCWPDERISRCPLPLLTWKFKLDQLSHLGVNQARFPLTMTKLATANDSHWQPTDILSQPGAIPTHNDQTCVVAIAFKRIPFLFCWAMLDKYKTDYCVFHMFPKSRHWLDGGRGVWTRKNVILMICIFARLVVCIHWLELLPCRFDDSLKMTVMVESAISL